MWDFKELDMLQERISAFNDSAFHRANIKSGNTTKQMQSNKEEKENQPFPTKKIVHSRKNLRLYERPSHIKDDIIALKNCKDV